MATYKATSWGRTRSPKGISEGVPDDYSNVKRSPSAVTVVAVGDLSATLASTDAGKNGYATENQRFLHVTVSGADNKSVIIYVYNYASQVWAALMVNDGDGTFSQATARTANSATAEEQPQTFIFEIAGADRVAFVSTDTITVHAACSTF